MHRSKKAAALHETAAGRGYPRPRREHVKAGETDDRRAAVLAATIALVVPAAAQSAASTGYAGAFAGEGKLSFTLKTRKGEGKLKEWAWSGLRLTCGANSQTTSGRYLFSMEVRHRSFSGVRCGARTPARR